jgi:flagellar protein FliO/FliZ
MMAGMFFSQLKTYCKNTLLAFNCLSLLILLSVSVYADETLVETENETQIIQEQNKPQNKLSDEKQKYSFLSKPLLSNASNQITKKDTSANKDALNVFLGLIVILVMIFSLAWFMKKMGYSNVTGQGQLKIIASLNLGQKEKIVLIQVGKQQLLVGMTATQINTLHVLDEVLEETDIKQFGTTGNGAFASKFSELLKHKQNKVK